MHRKRKEITSELVQLLGTSTRVIHGRSLSRVGVVGTEDRKNWGVYPISVVQILEALLAAIPGTPVDLGDVK